MFGTSALSIRHKLTLIMFVTCGAAILLACLVFAVDDILSSEARLKSELVTVAEITGSNTTAALTFGDAEAAQETLASLSAQEHIVEACVYRKDGSILARYIRQDQRNSAFPKAEPDREKIRKGHLILFRQIKLGGESLGTIYLKSDLGALRARGAGFAEIFVVVVFLSLGTAYLLSSSLQRNISEPILDLARAAFTVSVHKDYSIRAAKRNSDEIGFLFDRFNEMMGQIQRHEQALQQARNDLELRVDERTKELQKEVADREQAQQDLAERTDFLNSLIQNSPLAIIVAGPNRQVQLCNPAFEVLFGCRRDDALGHPIEEVVGSSVQEATQIIEQIMHGKQLHLITRRKRSDDSPVDVELYAVPLISEGKVAGALGMYQDITERIRAQETLVHAKEAAEAASRAKSEFLANMSHEIRTPMNGIIGMTELALDTALSPEQREYLTMVESSAHSLLVVLNDILDFSKIEAGKLDLQPVSFGLRQSVGDTLKTLSYRAHQKGLELTWRVGKDVPDSLAGDVGRLRQVLVNLVGNALKFTEKGEVGVEVEQEDGPPGSAILHFAVRDTGIGIPPGKRRLIFEPFTQGDSSTTRQYGGTGLGLGISERLVQMMGGKIWVESELGRGSTFHFTVEFGLAAPGENGDPAAELLLRGQRVLVVDDNETNRKILIEMLGHLGLRAETAVGFDDALIVLRNARTDHERISLMITDMQMPGQDGIALIAAVRAIPEYRALPVLILSSMGGPSLQRLRELRVAAHLLKPVQAWELRDAILTAFSGPPDACLSAEPLAAGNGRTIRPGLTVLLAEDNAVNSLLAQKLLERHGHTVLTAGNGLDAIAAVEREKSAIDVVLMDIQMPEMDGLTAIQTIRAREQDSRRHVPIIALTAHAMKGDRENCLAAGADDYVTKPLDSADLLQALDRVTKRETNFGGPPISKETADGPAMGTFDLAAALERMDGDRELLEEVARLFVAEWPKTKASLELSLKTRDSRACERLAHGLKGASAHFGARKVSDCAFQLEKLGRAGSHEDAQQQWDSVKKEVEHLVEEMGSLFPQVPS